MREIDGGHCVDFEVGDRSGAPFLRLYERLPERHAVGEGSAVNWNEVCPRCGGGR